MFTEQHVVLLFIGGPKDGGQVYVPAQQLDNGYTVEWVAQGKQMTHLYRSETTHMGGDESVTLRYMGTIDETED